jgi:hypothetical protein
MAGKFAAMDGDGANPPEATQEVETAPAEAVRATEPAPTTDDGSIPPFLDRRSELVA